MKITKKQDWNLLNPADLAILQKFNRENGNNDSKIIGEILPEPFIGNPEKAKVLLLALNPGFGGREHFWHSDNKFRKLIFDNIELKETDFPYYYLNTDKYFEKSPGHEWCIRVFKELINAIGQVELSQKICCIQFHGYHSKRYKYLGGILPSQEPTLDLIRSAMGRKIPIVVMRSKKLWFKTINKLENYPNLIVLKNPRNPTLSNGNMNEGDFNKVLKALRSN